MLCVNYETSITTMVTRFARVFNNILVPYAFLLLELTDVEVCVSLYGLRDGAGGILRHWITPRAELSSILSMFDLYFSFFQSSF